LEFIDPIFDETSEKIVRRFFLAGPRYYLGCNGTNCEKSYNVQIDENLILVLDPANPHDPNAIKIKNINGNDLGFLPRYYTQGVSQLISKGTAITCRVIEVNKDNKCNECIKVELVIHPNIVSAES
jgi:hypothetical protein